MDPEQLHQVDEIFQRALDLAPEQRSAYLDKACAGGPQLPSLNADGTRVAFESDRFANLGNADGNYEIFLTSCLSAQPTPTPTPTPTPVLMADLLISQSADKTAVKQGDTLTYTVTVRNFGPDDAANVLVNDTLSSGATFVRAQAGKGTFKAPPVGQTGTVTWILGNMPKDEQDAAQLTVTVTMRGKTTITNSAAVTSSNSDPNLANNTSELTTTLGAGSGKK